MEPIHIDGLNVLVGVLAFLVLIGPTIYSFASHLVTKRARSFSHVARPIVQAIITTVRATLIAGAFLLVATFGSNDDHVLLIAVYAGAVLVNIVFLLVFWRTDRRLCVNAETGLITWKFFSSPWWGSKRVAFVDVVGELRYVRGDLDLFRIERLRQRVWVTHNQNHYTEGHYPLETLAKLAESFDRYYRAFVRYDTDEAKERRRKFRADFERRSAPALERAQRARAARAEAVAIAKVKAKRTKAERLARIEADKEREIDNKFGP